jgi:hypothetical protein
MHDKRVLIPSFVAAESQMWQGYFLFCVRDVLRAAVFDRDGEAFRGDVFALRAAAAERDEEEAAGRAGFAAATRRGSETGAERWTMVKRV